MDGANEKKNTKGEEDYAMELEDMLLEPADDETASESDKN